MKRAFPTSLHESTLAIAIPLAFLAAACTPQLLSYEAALGNEGEVHLYLQPIPHQDYRIDFAVTAISAIRDDGSATRLRQYPAELKAQELLTTQKRLAWARLTPGLYKGVTIEMGAASLLGEHGSNALLVPEEPLFIEEEFTVARRRATALFLTLHEEEVVSDGFSFTPTFSLAGPQRQLTGLLGFATDSLTNTVWVFNKNTMEVVDTITAISGPKGIVIDQRGGWAYVALAGDDAVAAIEVSSAQILARIQLNFGDEPGEMALSPDGKTLLCANLGSNTVSILDTSPLREVGRIGLPSEATSVFVDPSGSRAYVLDALSRTISAIDLARGERVATRTLEEAPIRGAVSGDGNRLYVITSDSPNLLIIDPLTLTIEQRLFVGLDAASIKVDDKTEQVYVGKATGEIVVMDLSSLIFVDTFTVKGDAAFLAIDGEEGTLLVASPDSKTIQKIDLISRRPLGLIEVEGGSYAVAVMGER
jgi:YVTN family beta-propeller protein